MFLLVQTSWVGVGLTLIFETSPGMGGTAWGLSPHDLLLWASLCGSGSPPWKKQERASPNKQVPLQASACITSVYVP